MLFRLLSSSRNYFLGATSLSAVQTSQTQRKYPGNAPTMRAIPLAFLPSEDILDVAIANADSTHPHPKARFSSIAIAYAARYLMIERKDKQGVIKYVIDLMKKVPEHCYDSEVMRDLVKLDKLPDYHNAGETNGVPDLDYNLLCGETGELGADAMRTTFCILYILKYYHDPMDVLRTSIRIGGDVDSLASVCLGIVCGKDGLQLQKPGGIPTWIIDSLEDLGYVQFVAFVFREWYSETNKNK
eukprot:TRINITY_DN4673_c0_g1_i2.p1 TRINITY_DN4673_c0_g1~~TRINITY_DN4673_c0_g1_i2.p1  ORF type:complete len:242 (-),score=34.51 TRINITY_DN4673_c0_g1_i2:20-745(-)